jgi:sporulation protein YlmC with PRC-barrel domain
MATPKQRLQELKGSGYELSKNQPDIRGWEVRNEAGNKIGKIKELIFDTEAQKVRYMVVDIRDHKELDLEKRTVLVPIGLAELHTSDDDVVLHGVSPFQLRALPSYKKEDLGTKAEMAISTVFGRNFSANDTGAVHQNFYQHDHFNDERIRQRNLEPVRHEGRILNDAEESSLRRDVEPGRSVNEPYLSDEERQRLEAQRDLNEKPRRKGLW